MVASRYNIGATQNHRIVAADNNWLLGHWYGHPDSFYAENWVTSSSSPTHQTWKIYTGYCNVQSNVFKFYSNGQFVSQSNSPGQGPNNLELFNNGQFPQEYSAGTVGVVIVWDRLLNDAEIAEAYEYFRCRYGI
jgi:hypothetical protein